AGLRVRPGGGPRGGGGGSRASRWLDGGLARAPRAEDRDGGRGGPRGGVRVAGPRRARPVTRAASTEALLERRLQLARDVEEQLEVRREGAERLDGTGRVDREARDGGAQRVGPA